MKTNRGFALLIAIIFMSVMLSFSLSLSSLGYKQTILASSAIDSQYAFYVADAALECVLYADQQQNIFAYDAYDPLNRTKPMSCDGGTPVTVSQRLSTPIATQLISEATFSLDGGAHCATITVYKPNPALGVGTTYLFSEGYNVPCGSLLTATRVSARGLEAHY